MPRPLTIAVAQSGAVQKADPREANVARQLSAGFYLGYGIISTQTGVIRTSERGSD